eukprot:TRINITY_DN13775_c0_g1_i1.p1 TRINITY_DN13775_c0_g1~~TRINITY_DN13775_c0_g1_i1.p1  ORF type:complete len:452 (+),score=27.00 TRINITY_DN13775_c0_g1_i1:69-1358(+)
MAAELVCNLGHALKREAPKANAIQVARNCDQCKSSVSSSAPLWRCDSCKASFCFGCVRSRKKDGTGDAAAGNREASPARLSPTESQTGLPPLMPTGSRSSAAASSSSLVGGRLSTKERLLLSSSGSAAHFAGRADVPGSTMRPARGRSLSVTRLPGSQEDAEHRLPGCRLRANSVTGCSTNSRPSSADRPLADGRIRHSWRGSRPPSRPGRQKRMEFRKEVEWLLFHEDEATTKPPTKSVKPLRPDGQQPKLLPARLQAGALAASVVASATGPYGGALGSTGPLTEAQLQRPSAGGAVAGSSAPGPPPAPAHSGPPSKPSGAPSARQRLVAGVATSASVAASQGAQPAPSKASAASLLQPPRPGSQQSGAKPTPAHVRSPSPPAVAKAVAGAPVTAACKRVPPSSPLADSRPSPVPVLRSTQTPAVQAC